MDEFAKKKKGKDNMSGRKAPLCVGDVGGVGH